MKDRLLVIPIASRCILAVVRNLIPIGLILGWLFSFQERSHVTRSYCLQEPSFLVELVDSSLSQGQG